MSGPLLAFVGGRVVVWSMAPTKYLFDFLFFGFSGLWFWVCCVGFWFTP
jgi:hypothetical protein